MNRTRLTHSIHLTLLLSKLKGVRVLYLQLIHEPPFSQIVCTRCFTMVAWSTDAFPFVVTKKFFNVFSTPMACACFDQ